MYTAGLAPILHGWDTLRCNHTSHVADAGGKLDTNGWSSRTSAAYPADMNLALARTFASLLQVSALGQIPVPEVAGVEMQIPPTVVPTAETPMPPAPVQAPHAPHAPPETQSEPAPQSAQEDSTSSAAAPPPASPRKPSKPSTWERTGHPLRSSLRSAAHLTTGGPVPRIGHALASFGVSKLAGKVGAALVAAAGEEGDPVNRAHAHRLDHEGWMKSEHDELMNHLTNGSFILIDRDKLPPSHSKRRLVKFTWAYKVKRSGKLKARLCVQGCTQVAGIDYDQTFCATMRSGSLRLLSAIAAQLGLGMHRWDFVAAYLQGELLDGEVVYCELPPGISEHDIPGHQIHDAQGRARVCQVVKPIYGMAQAGRRWQRSLYPWLEEYGFEASKSDASVFSCRRTISTPTGKRNELVIIGCYVDDLACLHSHDDKYSLYHHFITSLQKSWEVEDEGDISDLLGVQIDRGKDQVTMTQTAYIDRMMTTWCPEGIPKENLSEATKTPSSEDLPQLVADAMFARENGHVAPPDLVKRYQSLCGALLYCATNTRPDIAYTIGMLCRVMSCPDERMWGAALRVLHYLSVHRHLGLRYMRSDSTPTHGFSDSDWAVKHSTTGFTFQYANATISWGSKKQTSVALSSCEAEIMAASEAAKEAVYLREFLNELGFGGKKPMKLYCDNQGAIDLAYNPEHHQKTKHIDRRHFYVRELVERGQLEVPYVKTAENLADFFTKPLAVKTFRAMRDKIMNMQQPDPDDISRTHSRKGRDE